MIVQRLDHVNIITDRLAETARFYAELLDLENIDSEEMQALLNPGAK